MPDISGYGLTAQIFAIPTFPVGITITQFADDNDPLDVPSQQLKDKAMSLNGNLVTWSKAVPIMATINVIPDSDDDIKLGILAESNRVGNGKSGTNDSITMVLMYPNGKVTTLIKGVITDAMMATGVASSGREKTKTYAFAFENKVDA